MEKFGKVFCIFIWVISIIFIIGGIIVGGIGDICIGVAFIGIGIYSWFLDGERLYWKERSEECFSQWEEQHKLTSDAIESSEKNLEYANRLSRVVDLFLDGIDDEVAEVINQEIREEGMEITFNYESNQWKLYLSL